MLLKEKSGQIIKYKLVHTNNKSLNGGLIIMPDKKKVRPEDSSNISENHYELENKENTEFDKGLAATHRQVRDHFFEGTIDQKYE